MDYDNHQKIHVLSPWPSFKTNRLNSGGSLVFTWFNTFDRMRYAILVISTWTKKESIYPIHLNSQKEAEDKIKELEGKCSVSKGDTTTFKNNEYRAITLLY